MIKSFGDKSTENLFRKRKSRVDRRFPEEIIKAALRKLDMLNAAIRLDDLRSPPGNRLEALKGDLKGFFSIRINEKWRIIFRWDSGEAKDVQIVDYH